MKIRKIVIVLVFLAVGGYIALDIWFYFRQKSIGDNINHVINKYAGLKDDSIPDNIIQAYEKQFPGSLTNKIYPDFIWCFFASQKGNYYPQIQLAYSISHTGSVKKFSIANQLDNKLSQKKCIFILLDRAYYGNQIKGIRDASEIYFGKRVEDLNEAECRKLILIQENPPKYLSEFNLSPIITTTSTTKIIFKSKRIWDHSFTLFSL